MALNSVERQGRNHRGACCLSVLFISFFFFYSHLSSLQLLAGCSGAVCFFGISSCGCHRGSDPHGTRHVINKSCHLL